MMRPVGGTPSHTSSATVADPSTRLVSGNTRVHDMSMSSDGVGGDQSRIMTTGYCGPVKDGGSPRPSSEHRASFENHLTKQNVDYKVILQFDDSYLKTGPGIIKFILTLLSVVSLICVTSSGTYLGSYLLLPMDWHLRAFVFTAVGCFLTSFLFLTIQITGLIKMFQFNWHFVDLAIYSCFTFLYLLAASLMAGSVVYYKIIHIKPWTMEQLIIASVFGYICMFFCGLLALNGYRKWRGSSQFRRFRLQELERLDRLYNLESV